MNARPIAFVSGALANKPANGGNAWTRLSWLLGLRRLGFEVYFVEQLSVTASGEGPPDQSASVQDSETVSFFRQTLGGFGFGPFSSLLLENGELIHGLPLSELKTLADRATFLFNISGHLTQPDLLDSFQTRVYFDDDPGYTQFWQSAESNAARLLGHHFHFTIGENIGAPDCPIPSGGLRWRHTRSPVLLEQWPAKDLVSTREVRLNRFTTVASWRGPYGPVEHDGKTYGLKVHQFRKFIDLPGRSAQKFEIALQIDPSDQKDLDALLAHGWTVVDPRPNAGSPQSFRSYVQNSGAEFSVAQGIYVDTKSGWFSDRTVRYLASGKPALVQDTGFTRHLPAGQGLLAFRTLEEAIGGAERIARDYRKHCRAARQVAEEFFDSDRVIERLLAEIGVSSPTARKVKA